MLMTTQHISACVQVTPVRRYGETAHLRTPSVDSPTTAEERFHLEVKCAEFKKVKNLQATNFHWSDR